MGHLLKIHTHACSLLRARIEELAKKKGVSMAQIAMAWVMAKPGVTAPVIGTTSLEKLEDILGKLRLVSAV